MASIKPIQTLRGTELDMRDSKLAGKELADEISAIVEKSQLYIMAPLPSWLRLTHRQFVSLLNYTEEMYQTTDRLFRTKWNIMEVDVDMDADPVKPEDIEITRDPTIQDFQNLEKSGRFSR